MLDFPASPTEGAFFNHPTAPNTFNYSGGKWRQDRAWVHLDRIRNIQVIAPPRELGAEPQAYGTGHFIALPPGYQFYKILLRRWEPTNSQGPSIFRVSANNGAAYIDAGYVWNGLYHHQANAGGSWNQTSWTGGGTYFPLTATHGAVLNNGGPNMFDIDIDRGGNGIIGAITLHSCVYSSGQGFVHSMISGYVNGTQGGMTNIAFHYIDYTYQYMYLNTTLGALDVFGAP